MDEPTTVSSRSRHPVAIFIASGLVVIALIAAAVLFWPSGSEADATVALLPTSTAGPDPFTEKVQIGAVPAAAPPAVAAITEVRDSLPADQATGTLVATGTAPGLYGGTGDAAVCDPEALVAFLDDHPDKAAAWSGVLGISTDGIRDYVAGLTPVVLTTDTVVTNHGFKNGRATSSPAVLQAGTAVMVDARGVPRVKCNCGNPLTPPEPVSMADATLTGERWSGFDTGAVATIKAGATVDELTLCNLRTGEVYTQAVGSGGSGGTPPPDLDGDWTLTLTSSLTDTDPLPPGKLDPGTCPNANLDGAVMVIKGTRASITDVPGGGDLTGTIEGAPADSPEWLIQTQQAFDGAVITLNGDDEDLKLIVVSNPEGFNGSIDTVDERGFGTKRCEVGIIARRAGGVIDPSAAPTPTTAPAGSDLPAGLFCKDLASRGLGYRAALDYWRANGQPKNMDADANGIPCETVYPAAEIAAASGPSAPAGAPGNASGGPCDRATLEAVVRPMVDATIESFDVVRCNGRWASVAFSYDGQEDPGLLEWTGTAWRGGVCERYGDPNDVTRSAVVPDEFWVPCNSD